MLKINSDFFFFYWLDISLVNKKTKKRFCKWKNKQAISFDPSLPALDFMAQKAKNFNIICLANFFISVLWIANIDFYDQKSRHCPLLHHIHYTTKKLTGQWLEGIILQVYSWIINMYPFKIWTSMLNTLILSIPPKIKIN